MGSHDRKRIAFIGVTVGFPAEKSNREGLPLMMALMNGLTAEFDIVIYPLIRIERAAVPASIVVRQATRLRIPSRLKFILLIMRFLIDHVRRPFMVINAISPIPSGRIGVILSKILKRPLVLHLNGIETIAIPEIGHGDLLDERLKKIVHRVCREATVLVALSAFQRNHTQKTLPDLRNVMVVIPRGVDLSRFSYRERTITSPVRFLHIASNQPFKDHTNLFRAFSIIRREIDCSMQIIGEGFDTDEIQRLLVTLNIGDDVSFVGMVKNTSLAAYFSEAHILLHSSRLEGLPGVALEAMASGVPVCSTAVGLLVDLGDPLVCLAPVNDPVSLANQTLALIRDSDRYRRQQQAARAYAVNHDASWSTKEYIQLFYSTTTT